MYDLCLTYLWLYVTNQMTVTLILYSATHIVTATFITRVNPLTLKALNIFIKPWRPRGFIQFEIIINVLVSSFWFIWIPMLWVYNHYKMFTLTARGWFLDVRIWRLQTSDSVVQSISPRCKCLKRFFLYICTGLLLVFKSIARTLLWLAFVKNTSMHDCTKSSILPPTKYHWSD